jgi:membrane fusion protein (multidrug efflux system)
MNPMKKQEAVPVDEPLSPVEPKAPVPRTAGRRRAFLIFFLVLALAGTGVFFYWLHASQFESTDDAYVQMHLDPVSSRVDGTIVKVYVEDNHFVHAGDPLVDLDPRDFQVALDQANAALNQARSQVSAQQPNVPITQAENTANVAGAEASVANAEAAVGVAQHDRDTATARLAEAEANNARAQSDLARYKILISKEEVSRQEYDQIEAAAKAQAANVQAARSAVESSGRVVDQKKAQVVEAQSRLRQYRQTAAQQVAIRQAGVRSQQANSQGAQAQVEQAKLRLSYTRIISPVDGIVMKRTAEVGAHVAAGQQLLTIAQTGDPWVTANFKETQLAGLQPNQPVRIHIDALRRDFDGYVENIGGGTGAVESVLPPENASGNFVKVVQRIPVRLRFKPNQEGLERLRAGMSAEPDVRIGK